MFPPKPNEIEVFMNFPTFQSGIQNNIAFESNKTLMNQIKEQHNSKSNKKHPDESDQGTT
jgi:hypothetical protein